VRDSRFRRQCACLGYEPKAGQSDGSERDEHQVGQGERPFRPLGKAASDQRADAERSDVDLKVPMFRARTIDAFGSARWRSSIRYVIAVPAASRPPPR